ncbi:unnamed protein product [Adineta steineri]|uniref:YncE family protein n=1 Tax=Adineta steineri TaxID=433720 RepID=A0A813W563_9BILA|nr:unnamed protein product [Adineta steineri]
MVDDSENMPHRLYVVTLDKSLIEIFDLHDQTKIGEINVPARPHEIIMDPHYKHLAYVSIPYREGVYNNHMGDGHEIVTIDLNENKIKSIYDLRPNHSKPHGMQIGPQTGYLYVSCESNNGEILRMDTHNELEIMSSIPTHAQGPHWFVILPLETKAYTANKELQYISVLDLKSNKFLYEISAPFGSENIVCSNDGQFVYLSTLSTSTDMAIVDTETDTILYHINLDFPPSGFIISPINPSLIYIRHMNVGYENGFYSTDNGYLQELNLETKQLGRRLRTGKNPIDIIITKNGKQAYVSCGMSHRIDIINLDSMTISGHIATSPSPHGIMLVD